MGGRIQDLRRQVRVVPVTAHGVAMTGPSSSAMPTTSVLAGFADGIFFGRVDRRL